MAKLSTLKPRLGGIGHRVGTAPSDERERTQGRRDRQRSQQWYQTRWWKETRKRILLRDLYTCMRCKRGVAGKGEAVVDHKKPHRDQEALFFCADAGLETLCKQCHSSAKQSEEAKDIKGVWY